MSAASPLRIGSARRLDLDAAGQPIAALQSGADEAPAVLLVPGYTGSKEDFGPILDPIADTGLRAVAIDLPGQLDSRGPSDPAEYRPEALGVVVREVARGLGGDCLLLGHSFGGLVARAAVLAEPKLFGSLVLLSSGPAQLGGGRRNSIDALEPVLAAGGMAAVWAAMEAAALRDPRFVAPPPDVQEFFRRRFFGSSPAMLKGMADALRAEPDRVAELVEVGLPVLVAHGVDDDAWPPAVQHEMAQRLGADYAVIPDAAHSPAVENPAGTVAALRAFWSR